ncbi:GNAT family N-acetyltransferase [Acinetobacter beijerinckii]|uniref:N-acetyltransferase domain-containing protein n=1 Tax=Acinetobacter beijerinckii CIP 110307 TaxID=1217648 RepID=N9FJ71_9GAMM|nr:GNAT family N-acetyltransferase [Acinetobacter beijerinckii]ENW07365.1 hypothetical protein F933_01843 [Acinetobacter beijerinckii CIP 110307]
MYTILGINSCNDIGNKILYHRANRAQGGRSIRIDREEVALLSYEDWSEKYIGFIYEIYVLPNYRYQGIGELLLSYAERKACELKCKYIKLKPYPLDEKTQKDRLIAWYKKNGYFQSPDKEEKIR